MRIINFVSLAFSIIATTFLTLESAIHNHPLFTVGVCALGLSSITALCQVITKGETE